MKTNPTIEVLNKQLQDLTPGVWTTETKAAYAAAYPPVLKKLRAAVWAQEHESALNSYQKSLV